MKRRWKAGGILDRVGRSEVRVLRKVCGTEREEVTGGWRKLRNVKPHVLYCSPNIIQVIKLRKRRWVGHVAWTEEKR
jgi:hypothetical protein